MTPTGAMMAPAMSSSHCSFWIVTITWVSHAEIAQRAMTAQMMSADAALVLSGIVGLLVAVVRVRALEEATEEAQRCSDLPHLEVLDVE